MNILLISPTSAGIGGVAQHVKGLSQFLTDTSHKVDILSSENTLTIPIKGLKNPSFMLSSFLKTKFKKNNDIVHAHNIPAGFAMRNASGKKVLSLHGIYSEQIAELHGSLSSKVSKKYENDALNMADAITTISKVAYNHYSKMGYNVVQIPHAIDLNHIPQKTIKKFENQIIFAGRSGPEEKKVQKIANEKTNVHYLGYQSKQNTVSLIRGSDLLIQPSLVEGMSSTLLEAMGCSTCIIATNVGGNSEIIENNKTGILIEPNNSEKLLDKISNLLVKKEKRINLATEARKSVEKYNWKRVGQLYLDVYESLLN